jgi:hypothetical protein
MVGQGSISFGNATSGDFFIASSNEGNLIVGNSLKPFLDVYSPQGSKVATIPLNIKPIPVTKPLISEYKKHHIDRIGRNSRLSQDQIQNMQKRLKKASWDHLFSGNLPLYREILVDSEGNILVFTKTDCLEDCPIAFHVYSLQGEFVCETELVEGPFSLTVDSRINNMYFTDSGLITMVGVKDAAEFELRVIKVPYK